MPYLYSLHKQHANRDIALLLEARLPSVPATCMYRHISNYYHPDDDEEAPAKDWMKAMSGHYDNCKNNLIK
jgi:hypothetical protein